jgi:hypothetical protein
MRPIDCDLLALVLSRVKSHCLRSRDAEAATNYSRSMGAARRYQLTDDDAFPHSHVVRRLDVESCTWK